MWELSIQFPSQAMLSYYAWRATHLATEQQYPDE